MSGGVGPTAADISLPEDAPAKSAATAVPSHQPSRRRFLSFRQLNAVAVAVILSFTGMVPIEDLAFTLLSLPYIYFLASFAFPLAKNGGSNAPVFGERNFVLSVYVLVGAVVGLLLPIAYILHGVYEGDKEGIKAAAPHVFLLASQVFMEGVTFSGNFALPIRVFVPVVFNGKRMFTIGEWLRSEVVKEEEEEHGSAIRLWVGRGLAIANLIFWGFNLFGFLLPIYLPRAFKRYKGSSTACIFARKPGVHGRDYIFRQLCIANQGFCACRL